MTTSKNIIHSLIAIGAILCGTANLRADIYTVNMRGTVEWNELTGPPLSAAQVGDAATLSFNVDANNFVNDPTYPTRGYVIDPTSYQLTLPTFSIGLKLPAPTTYFVLRNNDPAVDGFFVSTNTTDFGGVTINQLGQIAPLTQENHITYGGSTLSSLNLADAVGHYDYTNLTVFNWVIDDGPFDAMGIDFVDMTIAPVPEPATAGMAIVAGGALLASRRRRRADAR